MALSIFIVLFLAGVIGIGVLCVRKIPLVLTTPRDVVNDYIEQSSARFHVRFSRVRAWMKNGAYWDPVLVAIARVLRWIRVWVLRLDRYSFSMLQSVAKRSEERKQQARLEEDPLYWQKLTGSADERVVPTPERPSLKK